MRWDIINNVVTIVSSLPIEKVFIQRPYQPERPVTLVSGTPVLHPVPIALEEADEHFVEPASEYAGFSQISAAGKACIPCSNDHFSTVAGELAEAIRFARDGGITHPEVMFRITDAEDQLNALERIDGAPAKVEKLPPAEKAFMNAMIASSRHMRHLLKDITNTEDLEALAAHAQGQRQLYRTRLFELQMSQLTPEQMQKVEEKAAGVIA